MNDYRHILLIKPSSMGDIVHAMPTCAAIRRAYPKARLTWLVKREWAGLVERIEGVDRVWPVDSTLIGWLSQVSPLRAEHFDLVIDLQGLLRSAAIGWLSGSPLLVGFANGREGSPWESHPVSVESTGQTRSTPSIRSTRPAHSRFTSQVSRALG